LDTRLTAGKYPKVPDDDDHPQCDICYCGRDTKYVVAYDFIYSEDRDILCCTWMWVCREHLKSAVENFDKANRDYAIYEIKPTPVKVSFT
jgi:hypothetical protein